MFLDGLIQSASKICEGVWKDIQGWFMKWEIKILEFIVKYYKIVKEKFDKQFQYLYQYETNMVFTEGTSKRDQKIFEDLIKGAYKFYAVTKRHAIRRFRIKSLYHESLKIAYLFKRKNKAKIEIISIQEVMKISYKPEPIFVIKDVPAQKEHIDYLWSSVIRSLKLLGLFFGLWLWDSWLIILLISGYYAFRFALDLYYFRFLVSKLKKKVGQNV